MIHYTLEDLWREERNETKRRFLQGLIQASVSFYHPPMADKGNLKGAKSRFGKSLQKLEVFPTEYENLRVAELVHEWKKIFDNIGSVTEMTETDIGSISLPRIKYALVPKK